MPPTATVDMRTSSMRAPGLPAGAACFYRNDLLGVFQGSRFGIWLPEGGQTSPIREDRPTFSGAETPLEAVKRRVCAEAYKSLDRVRQLDNGTTAAQVRLATSLLVSLEKRILSERSLYTQFSTVHLGVMDDGELVLEWFYDKGRIQFFIDAELDDSMAVFLDGTDGGLLPRIENMPISIGSVDEVSDRAVRLAMELA